MQSSLSSLTNQSYSLFYENNDLKLNLDTPSAESVINRPHPDLMLDFEEFTEESANNAVSNNVAPQKTSRRDTQLFIKVEDNSFNCKLNDAPGVRHKRHFIQGQTSEHQTASEANNNNQTALVLAEYKQKVEQLQRKNKTLVQSVQTLENDNRLLSAQLKSYTVGIQQLKAHMKKKDQTIDLLTKRVNKANEATTVAPDQSKVVKDLNKRIEKLSSINKGLQKQLREAMVKVVQLEKEAQIIATHQLQENRLRFKDSVSHNKQNFQEHSNNLNRKSLEGLKEKRSSRLNLDKKTKSIAPITRLKYTN